MNAYVRWLGEQVTSGEPQPYTVVLFGTVAGGALLWVYDGMPLARDVIVAIREAIRSVVRPG